jgi:cob(I)alamin adenosyltransferase
MIADTDLSLDAQQQTRITVMEMQIKRLEEKQEELRERIKALEKWVIGAGAVIAAGVTVIGFLTNISKAYL